MNRTLNFRVPAPDERSALGISPRERAIVAPLLSGTRSFVVSVSEDAVSVQLEIAGGGTMLRWRLREVPADSFARIQHAHRVVPILLENAGLRRLDYDLHTLGFELRLTTVALAQLDA